MKRIFSSYAYGAGPRAGCWWDETCDVQDFPKLETDIACDVAIVGAGFTGLNAALYLAEAGVNVVVIDAQNVGWGASGRNGGFCCLGGAKASDMMLDKRFGKDGRLAYRGVEKNAVAHVDALINWLGIDVDRHSVGETELAHRPRHMATLVASAERVAENYGVTPTLLEARELAGVGMGGSFHGAMTIPVGFALNPRKYIAGLARAATAGRRADVFANARFERHIRADRHATGQDRGPEYPDRHQWVFQRRHPPLARCALHADPIERHCHAAPERARDQGAGLEFGADGL